jgi:alcohol dehydrogenase class IV
MQFSLRMAGQIHFGRGAARRAVELTTELGKRVFVVTGGKSLERTGQLARIAAELDARAAGWTRWVITREPDVAVIDAAVARCREADCDVVLAIGGGSVLDAGKAVAALSPNSGSVIEYLEDVGRGAPRPLTHAPLPVVALPTTCGSGSETTRNSVVRVPELKVKRSLRSDLLLPRIAIIDPELAEGAPLAVAAAAGLDALTHLIEGYVSRGAQPTTDALALRGLGLAAQALSELGSAAAKSDATFDQLALASLWGGIVLANAGLGAVHGLVAPLGGQYEVAHGDACACLLPATLLTNIAALKRRTPSHPALARYQEIIAIVCPSGPQTPEHAAQRLSTLRQQLGVVSLRDRGVSSESISELVAKSRGGSMRSNPIDLLDQELEGILLTTLAS